MIVAGAIGGAILLWIIITLLGQPIYTVEQQTFVVIERFGKFVGKGGPGLRFKLPYFDRVAGRVSVRVQELNVKVRTKTSDNVFVDLMISVQYYVDDVWKAFYKLAKPDAQMESYVYNTVRAKVPTMKLDDVFEKKDEIAKQVEEDLSTTMKEFGFSIKVALVNDVIPDKGVADAMNEINRQQRLKDAATYEGEVKKTLVVKAAEADAEAKKQAGIGIANQRKEISKGWQEAVGAMASGLNVPAAEIMALMVMTQHYDVLSEFARNPNGKAIFVPYTPGGVTGMRDDIMQALQIQGDSKVHAVVDSDSDKKKK